MLQGALCAAGVERELARGQPRLRVLRLLSRRLLVVRELVSAPPPTAKKEQRQRPDEQREPDDAHLGEKLQRQVVRLRREVEERAAVAQVRDVERPRTRARELVVQPSVPSLLPPREPEVRARV